MKYVVIIFVTVAVTLLGAYIYFRGIPKLTISIAPPTATSAPVITEGETQTPEPVDDSTLLANAVSQGLVAAHGTESANLTITVSKIEGDYAKGMANSETGGGGLWFASKINGDWALVWDGNGIILCSDLVSYPEFPKDLIPQCFNDKTNKLESR